MTRARASIEDAGKPAKGGASAAAAPRDKAKIIKIGIAVVALMAAGYLLLRQFDIIGKPAPQPTLEQQLPPETLQKMEEERIKTEKIQKNFKSKGSS